MTSAVVSVFGWAHQGRREVLFLEWDRAAPPIMMDGGVHFLRVTRHGNIRMGHVGSWHLQMENGRPVLLLENFSCDVDLPLHQLRFACAEWPFMRDENGVGRRRIRYLGRCTMGYSSSRCCLMQCASSPALPEEDFDGDWVFVRLEP